MSEGFWPTLNQTHAQGLTVRMALYNGVKLGEQTRDRPASRLQIKEAIDRTLKSVRRFLAHFGSDACAATYRTHGTLDWPKTWRADSGQVSKMCHN